MNNLPIPKHWSPHQALWEAYQEPLLDILVNHTTDDPSDDTTLDHDLNDDIPF